MAIWHEDPSRFFGFFHSCQDKMILTPVFHFTHISHNIFLTLVFVKTLQLKEMPHTHDKNIKGDAIRFVSGKYGGCVGWIDMSKEADCEITPVVVDRKRKGEKRTYVQTCQIRYIGEHMSPDNYAEAVMQQCPDIEKAIVETTRKIAKCNIGRDEEGFNKVIRKELEVAKKWHEGKGSKALCQNIRYP